MEASPEYGSALLNSASLLQVSAPHTRFIDYFINFIAFFIAVSLLQEPLGVKCCSYRARA